MRPFFSSTNVRKMNPNFVVAALIFLSEPKHVVRDCEGTMISNWPFGFRARWFQKHAYIGQSPGTPAGPHKGVGPGGTGRFTLANASSTMLLGRRSLPEERRHAAPLKSPATMSTCSINITVRTVRIHFLRIPRFLA